jgi:hypothetical protein
MSQLHKLRKHPLYRFTLWFLLAVGIFILWKMNASVLSNPAYIPVDDFSHYWAGGRLVLSGENSYDPNLVQNLRNKIAGGQTSYETIPIMWTPPWSLPFLMPFGLFDYPNARLLWLITHITLLLIFANLTWKIFHNNTQYLWVGWAATFLFGPTISVMEKGQITPWVLAGIVGFVFLCIYKKNDFVAGMAICLIALKPQLFFLFWPALLMWVIKFRRWRVIAGLTISAAAIILIPMIFNPNVLSQYFLALSNYPPTDWATHTIGGYLRLLLGVEKFWLQFIPPALGLVWFLFYWRKHQSDWSWTKAIPDLVLVSILTAPYAWTYDQVILVPAMVAASSCEPTR